MKEQRNKDALKSRYLETSEALEKIRAIELASMTEEEVLRQMFALATAETPWRESDTWSGLVEQQALFYGGARNERYLAASAQLISGFVNESGMMR